MFNGEGEGLLGNMGIRYAWSRVFLDNDPLAVGYTYRIASPNLLVMVHGLGGARHAFSPIWQRPEFANYSLMTIDFSGHGLTSPPEEKAPELPVQAYLLEQVLGIFQQMYPHNHVHLVAHGMGTTIALLMSQERLASLASFASLEGDLISSDCALADKVISLPEEDFRKTLPPEFKKNIGTQSSHLFLDMVKPKAFWQCAQSLVNHCADGAPRHAWNQLAGKKVYFYGEHSAKKAVLKDLAPLVKREVSSCGHFMMLEQPDIFYPMLAQFLLD